MILFIDSLFVFLKLFLNHLLEGVLLSLVQVLHNLLLRLAHVQLMRIIREVDPATLFGGERLQVLEAQGTRQVRGVLTQGFLS